MKLTDLFTEKDGLTLDLKRVLVIPASILSPIAMQVMDVLHGHAFDPRSFCEGLAAVIAAIAALLGLHAFAKGENGQ